MLTKRYGQNLNIRTFILIFLFFVSITPFTYAGLNATAGGAGDRNDCDHHVSSNVENVNGCGGGCGGSGGGMGGDDDISGGGGGTPSCSPFYVDCVSEANACGYVNYGRRDIACGGGCSARKPELPEFTIEGKKVKAGGACDYTDACGNKVTDGVLSCSGLCLAKDVKAICEIPGDTVSSFSYVPGWEIFSPWGGGGSSENNWPPNLDDKYVAIHAFPNIVKKGDKSRIFLMLYGLDYCIVKGTNGDEWNTFGLNSDKQKYIKKQLHNKKCKDNKNLTLSISRGGNDKSDEKIFKCPDEEPQLDKEIEFLANVAISETATLQSTVRYTVEKCFVMDHMGRVIEYQPDKENGDIPYATVKVTPKFIEN